ncbi:MAG: bifunctional DNA-formamidopyrimidine glycosylase/DNA-(apurinic or apyrimidinic site) lyase [Planctomycetota bacterium]|nr:bifunctional DNA-formamidopyrimidine glycosylase/DNA-(apurinic or apyrimidinic site) lyase [Planctomycetota bacterium]
MPELPEVEHLCRHLRSSIQGATVNEVQLHRPDVVNPSGVGSISAPTPKDLLLGGTILKLDRKGKQLAIEVDDGRILCIHLGMSGRVQVIEPGEPDEEEPHTHCVWKLRGGPGAREIRFIDPRRFGGLWTLASRKQLLSRRWRQLGPDALSVNPETLAERLSGRSRGIKSALLDQVVLAGMGNIYVDETLFRAKLHPNQPAGTLRKGEIHVLVAEMVGILQKAITMGGSTVRSWLDSTGQEGTFASTHQVYGRSGELCVSCGQLLKDDIVAQRQTVWCSNCQPFRRRRR